MKLFFTKEYRVKIDKYEKEIHVIKMAILDIIKEKIFDLNWIIHH
jgi:hypothetical protein